MDRNSSSPTYSISAYVVRPSNYDKVVHRDRDRWCLTVADAGDGWAIRKRNMCLNFGNGWELEPPPALRDAAFLQRCRFNEHAALLRARRLIDTLTVRDETFDDFHARIRRDANDQAQQYLEFVRRRGTLQRLTSRILTTKRTTAHDEDETELKVG